MINLKKSLFCGVILLLIFSVNIINANQQKSKSQILLDMAKQYYDSGKYSEAAELLQKAFEEEPTNDRILNLLVDSIVKRDTIGKSKLSEPSRQPASTTAVMPSQNANVNVNPLTELKAQGEKIRSEVISGVNIQQQLPSQSPQPQQQNAALPAIKPQLIIPASQEVRIAQNQNVAEDISYFAQPQSLNADNYKTFGLPQTKAPRSVSKIEVLFFQDTTQIIIDADENCNYVIERLREPWPMYVIDVIDATNYLPRGKRFELNKGIVRRIRHSQYREVPVKTTRVVVDLANWNTNISITRVKNKIVVDIANAINIAQPPLRNTGQIVAQNIDLGLPLEKFDIEVVSYDPAQQMGLVNKQPIVVKLLKEGKPAANERIIFESITELAGFKTDAGIYNLTELITDDFGIAKVLNFIVRPVLGENLIKIYPLKDNSVVKIISIGSVPGKPHKIVKVSGDNQKLNINNPNNEPFVVKVLDKDDNPVGEGVPVIFSTINRDCKIDVNLDNPYDNEVVTYTDSNSIARCDRFFVGMEPGMKILKASILIDEPAKLPTKLVVTSTASLSEAVETFIKGLDLKTNNDISVMIYETADTLNLNALRDDVYVSLKQSGKVEIMPHLNTLYVSDENIYFTDVPVKLLNYANFNIISKTLRTVNFTVNVAPRLVTINFKGAELVDVIRTLAELGDWNISYAEEDVAGKQVNLHLIDVPAIVALDTILDMNDLTRVQSGNLMKIMQKAKSIQSPLPIKSDYNEDFGIGDNFITQIVQLMNVDGLRMLDTIRELVSPNGRITYEQNTNSFIIIDSKSNVRKLLQIIKAFDISAKSGREYLKIYKLTFAEAEAVKNLLEGLMTKNREEIAAAARKEKSSTKKTTTTKKTDKAAAEQPQQSAVAQPTNLPVAEAPDAPEDAVGKFQLQSDAKIEVFPSKRMLLIQTTEGNHKVIESIIKELDVKESGEKQTAIIDLSKYPQVPPLEFMRVIQNSRSLKANLEGNKDDGRFIQVGGEFEEEVKDQKVYKKTIRDPRRYMLLSAADKILVIGHKEAVREIMEFVNEFIEEVLSKDIEINFESFVGRDIYLERVTLKYISPQQFEDYFKQYDYSIPLYVAGLKSKTGKEDVLVIGTSNEITDFSKRVKILDIPELADRKLDGLQADLYKLKNVSVDDVEKLKDDIIKPVLSKAGSITFIKNINAVVVRDKRHIIDEIFKLLKSLDMPYDVIENARKANLVMPTEVIPLRNMEVGALKGTFNNFDTIKSKDGNIVFDYVSNSVIIRDFPANIKKLKEVIEKMDDNAKNSNWMITKIFYLKHASVSDKLTKNNIKVNKINEILDKVIKNSITSIDAKDGTIFGNVAYDERSNAVIITTFRNLMPQIERLIEQLDRREKQIMIEVMIVEREVTNDEAFGINGILGVDRYNYFTSATSSNPGADGRPIDRVNATGAGGGFQPGLISGAPFWVTINAKQMSAILQAIKMRSSAEVLSNPKVLTLNNQPAFVELKDIIQTPKYEKDENGIFKPVDPDKTEIPLSLKVVPQINNEREVLLNVDLQIATLPADYDKSLGLPPSPTSRTVQNMFYLADNQTIVIGGIIKRENRVNESKLPFFDFLDKVPLVNMLTRKTSKSSINKELLIFITPYIIDGPIQSEQISRNVKDKYSDIIFDNFYLNTSSRSEIMQMYLTNIYNVLVENYFERNRQLGMSDYNIKRSMPEWLAKDNAPRFAEALANAIINYREQYGPIASYEQLQFINVNFNGRRVPIRDDLYLQLVNNTQLNININLATIDEISRIKGLDYMIAQKIIEKRNELGYFKNREQVRYYFVSNGIPASYYDEYLAKVITIGDLKEKTQIQENYRYFHNPQQSRSSNNTQANMTFDVSKIEMEQNTNAFDSHLNNNITPPPAPNFSLNTNKVNLNTANVDELENRLNISKLDAMLIVKYRERVGSYKTIEDLKNVYGIDKIYDSIKDKVFIQ